MARRVIMLAAGGTGGHIFPALAVGEYLQDAGWRAVFITDRRGKHMIPKHFTAITIAAASPFAENWWQRMARLSRLGFGLLAALIAIIMRRPKAIIGFGGYAAVPPLVAARGLGVPIVIHEQNASMGRANRFLVRFAKKCATSWQHTKGYAQNNHVPTIVTGTPVRAAFHRLGVDGYQPPNDEGIVRLLIIGGSLGASVFGDTVPEAISRLPAALKARLHIVHQVRTEQIAAVEERYKQNGISAKITPFIADMAHEMAEAHLVICRAGASSVAELAAAGRPALLVPYPDAMDDHQTANAKGIHDIGGGWLIPEAEMSAGSLAGKIAALVADPARLTIAATNVLQLAKPQAAADLAEHVLALTKKGGAA